MLGSFAPTRAPLLLYYKLKYSSDFGSHLLYYLISYYILLLFIKLNFINIQYSVDTLIIILLTQVIPLICGDLHIIIQYYYYLVFFFSYWCLNSSLYGTIVVL